MNWKSGLRASPSFWTRVYEEERFKHRGTENTEFPRDILRELRASVLRKWQLEGLTSDELEEWIANTTSPSFWRRVCKEGRFKHRGTENTEFPRVILRELRASVLRKWQLELGLYRRGWFPIWNTVVYSVESPSYSKLCPTLSRKWHATSAAVKMKYQTIVMQPQEET